MKALVTGISGFAGSHLADYLLSQNVEVFGMVRSGSKLERLGNAIGRIRLVECDLREEQAVHRVVKTLRPDLIFHLGAQSSVPVSWSSPIDTLHNNIAGQIHLMDAVRLSGIDCKIQIAASSEAYGSVQPHEVPLKETNPLRPLSPYAVSKATQELLGYQYFKSYGLPIVVTRAFNHIGPRQSDNFVASSFARQIARIEKGESPPVLYVGNLEACRDFTDVRDVVRAYWLALKEGEPGEIYNVASGECRPIRELLERLLSLAAVEIKVKQDPDRLRPADAATLYGDYSKLERKTGWRPEIPFSRTLEDLLEDWRKAQ